MELCVKAADGRVPVVAGTGALTTDATVEFSKHAADVGADAVMVVPPFYDTLTVPELKEHLQAVHDGCGLPIVYYNIPGITGLRLSAAQLADLGQVPGVRYIKDTSGDAVALSELLIKHAEAITTFNGWDTLTFLGIASGAKGSVWGAVNIFPELAVELWDTVAIRKDLDAGRALWARLWPLCDFLEARGYAACGRISEHADIGIARFVEPHQCSRELCELHEADCAFLHARTARGRDDNQRRFLFQATLDRARDLFAYHRTHAAADEFQLERADLHLSTVQQATRADYRIG